MKKYCPNCGFGNEYTLDVPESCGKCKNSLSFNFTPAKKQEEKIVPRRTIVNSKREPENEEEYEDESELSEYNLNSKAFSVEVSQPTTYSFKQLITQKPTNETRQRGNYKKKGQVQKEIKKIMSQRDISTGE